MTVNIFASVGKNSDIALGNIVGSNIFNILFILGLSSIVYPLTVKTNTTWIEVPLTLMSALVVLILANDIIINHDNTSAISRSDGIIMLFFFAIFMVYNIQLMLKGTFEEEIQVKSYSVIKSVLLIIVGLGLLVLGGRIIVTSAIKTAQLIGIPERVIALTIVSVGTSLPELATSAVAAKKRNVDIAIGNIVGSNIFNVFFILGTSSVIYPVAIQRASNFDMLFNLLASILLFVFIFTGRGRRLDRWEGSILMGTYIAYVVVLLLWFR